MDRLKMSSVNKINENIEKISNLFPNCLTERIDINGKIKLAIDFDILKQELSSDVVEGSEERYQFTWPDKKKSVLLSNAPIAKTLRPCKEESINFDTTENIYIEGDNLDVLKLLQETYLNKIKMIYIDPPYNTGNDFIYKDDFSQNAQDYLQNSGQFDEDGNRLFKNMETNGRFHTDWLNMIYPRLKLAKDLLRDDGVIFISIDDNEQANLKKICDEIFGESNFVASIPRVTKKAGKSTNSIAKNHDYIVCYSKNVFNLSQILMGESNYTEKDEFFDERGGYRLNQTLDYDSLQYNKSMDFEIDINGVKFYPGGYEKFNNRLNGEFGSIDWVWRWSKDKFEFGYKNGFIEIRNNRIYTKTYFKATISKRKPYKVEIFERTRNISSLEFIDNKYSNDNANKELSKIFNHKNTFDYPKNVELIKFLILCSTGFNYSNNFSSIKKYDFISSNDIILDFFSGSATTAHAVMQLNAQNLKDRVEISEKNDINLDKSKIDLAQNNMVNSNFSSTPPQALRF